MARAPAATVRPAPYTYPDRPLLIYWELTRACDLVCRHCRASAVPRRHPAELGTEEALALLDRLEGFGPPLPHLVMTGGDILHRPDLEALVEAALGRGFPLSLSPSATPRLTPAVLERWRGLGVASLSLSLDGASPQVHDGLRGVPGCFDWTLRLARRAVELGLALQINTLVCAETAGELPALYRLLEGLGIARWSLFFLVETGRGRVLKPLPPGRAERTLVWLWETARSAPFPIKTTEAHHFRRVGWVRLRRAGLPPEAIRRTPLGRGFGVRDGNGILFISHTGEVYPSGFLPLPVGNVRRESPVRLYRESRLFRALRDPDRYRGKCGACEFRYICGGSRARAFAHTGDPLGSDPLCPYRPRGGEVVG